MIIILWNIRSVLSNRDTLMNIIRDFSPDIIGLNETWLNRNNSFNILGYVCLRADRDDGKGGIAFLIRDSIPFNLVDISNISVPAKFQHKIIELEMFYLALIYNPPDSNLPKNFFTHLTAYAGVGVKKLMLMGDFNAQHMAWGSDVNNSNGFILTDILETHNLTFLNNGDATRITPPNQHKSVPDLILGNNSLLQDYSFEVLSDYIGMSDHLPILCKNVSMLLNNNNFLNRYNTKKANWPLFYDCLTEYDGQSNSLSYHHFVQQIKNAANKSIPVNKKEKRLGNPWWDKDCDIAWESKRAAFKTFKRQFTEKNYILFRKARAQCRKVLREKRKLSFNNYCSSLSPLTPINEVWCKIKRFSKSINQISLRKPLNCSIAEDMLALLAPPIIPDVDPDILFQKCQSSNISLEETQVAIFRKQRDSAPGIDLITYSMINNLPLNHIKFLVYFFNQVLYHSELIPDDWKTGLVCPIPKPNKNLNNISGYRPITLTSCIGKIMEDIVKCRLDWYVENHKILSDSQFGFRKGKGVFEALTSLCSSIISGLSYNKFSVIVFLDMKNAYDKVNISILIRKLAELGIEENICKYIKEIHTNRKIYIVDNFSKKLIGPGFTNKGLAQGSPLAPILFNIYINNVSDFIGDDVKLIQYADDIALLAQGYDIDLIVNKLNVTLDSLEEWARLNEMSFSPEKSSCILIQRKFYNRILPDIKFQNHVIRWVEYVKYLGIFIDNRFSWNHQIEAMCSKATKGINLMRYFCKTWWGGHPITMLNFFKSYIRSHLDYGSILLAKCSKKLLEKLDKVHFQALRICLGFMRSCPTNIILSESAELPLNIRRNFLATKLLLKAFSIQDNPIIQSVTEAYGAYNQSFGFWSRYYHVPPLIEGIDQIFPHVQDVDVVNMHHYYKFPLYFSKNEYLRLDLNKSENNSIKFREVIELKFKQKIKFFTDASKEVNKNVGVGIFCRDLNLEATYMIPGYASIFVGEMFAIMMALNVIESKELEDSVIFSDSESALRALAAYPNFKDSQITFATKRKLFELREKQFRISLAWLPSHTNILGNDKADQLANIGKTNGRDAEIKCWFTDFIPILKEKFWSLWKGRWKEISCTKGKNYAEIVTFPYKSIWFRSCKDFPRKRLTTFFRLRSGHCLIPSHLHRIGVNADSLCECGEIGTLNHIFFECNKFPALVDKLYKSLIGFYKTSPHNFTSALHAHPIVVNIIGEFLDSCGINL